MYLSGFEASSFKSPNPKFGWKSCHRIWATLNNNHQIGALQKFTGRGIVYWIKVWRAFLLCQSRKGKERRDGVLGEFDANNRATRPKKRELEPKPNSRDLHIHRLWQRSFGKTHKLSDLLLWSLRSFLLLQHRRTLSLWLISSFHHLSFPH